MRAKKMDIITNKIRIALIEKNITISELSKELNLNVNTISRWLNNNNLDNISKFLDMMILLDLDIKDIKNTTN